MKNLTLENDYLNVNINLLGAELTSLVDKRDGVEHMWSGDAKFWSRIAPILFPCVGESRDGKIEVDGKTYPMGRHGFVRNQKFSVVTTEAEKVVLELVENEETLKSYPFKFRFRVSYTLLENKLEQHFEVLNTGNEILGFQVGGHPAFRVPFNPEERYEDYHIRFDQPLKVDRHLLNDKGLYNGETRNVLNNEDSIVLSYDLFKEDALVFRNIQSKQVCIERKNGGKRLQVDFEGFPHLGIWSVPGADYVCIEPWVGCADMYNQPTDFFAKDSLIELESNETFNAAFTMSLV